MQERLHIDEIKRVEKLVNTLLKSWQKLTKNHTQLEEKYTIICEEMSRLKARHQQEIAEMEQRYSDAETAAKFALSEAVAEENRHWQQKYDETCAEHEKTIHELNEAHQNTLHALEEQAQRSEQILKNELAQVSKVKEALSNRVLGVAE